MAKPFKGTINAGIRDPEPDWTPFEPPVAPCGAPSVLYIVLDDVGFSGDLAREQSRWQRLPGSP